MTTTSVIYVEPGLRINSVPPFLVAVPVEVGRQRAPYYQNDRGYWQGVSGLGSGAQYVLADTSYVHAREATEEEIADFKLGIHKLYAPETEGLTPAGEALAQTQAYADHLERRICELRNQMDEADRLTTETRKALTEQLQLAERLRKESGARADEYLDTISAIYQMVPQELKPAGGNERAAVQALRAAYEQLHREQQVSPFLRPGVSESVSEVYGRLKPLMDELQILRDKLDHVKKGKR